MSATPLIEVQDLSRRFGGVRALAGVSFRVFPGDVVGIIGPNGSGKTTLINCITGFVKPTAGRVLFREREITGMPPHRIADLGVTRTFQIMRPYGSLPAFQNLVIPLSSPRARRLGGWRGGGRHGNRDTVAVDILEELGFERDSRIPRQIAGTLPTGYLKRLELGRCIALRPEVILCDEIFSGLSLSEIASLVPLIEKFRDRGITLIMIEHRLRQLFQVATRVLALSQGQIIAEGDPRSVIDHPAVRDAYLGGEEEKPA
ncbi:MAG: ABC transporter ATP-binding protein [bacterium]|nr:ABC transporter ATP-binding protein [bacterium]